LFLIQLLFFSLKIERCLSFSKTINNTYKTNTTVCSREKCATETIILYEYYYKLRNIVHWSTNVWNSHLKDKMEHWLKRFKFKLIYPTHNSCVLYWQGQLTNGWWLMADGAVSIIFSLAIWQIALANRGMS